MTPRTRLAVSAGCALTGAVTGRLLVHAAIVPHAIAHPSSAARILDAVELPLLLLGLTVLLAVGVRAAVQLDRATRRRDLDVLVPIRRLAVTSIAAAVLLAADIEIRILSSVATGQLREWIALYPPVEVIAIAWFLRQTFGLIGDLVARARQSK